MLVDNPEAAELLAGDTTRISGAGHALTIFAGR
jgi:hypothetical protein